MQDLIQSDIFFFVTTITIVIVAIFVVVALVYLIQILKNVKSVSEIVKNKAFFLALDSPLLKKWMKKIFGLFKITFKKKSRRK